MAERLDKGVLRAILTPGADVAIMRWESFYGDLEASAEPLFPGSLNISASRYMIPTRRIHQASNLSGMCAILHSQNCGRAATSNTTAKIACMFLASLAL